MRTVILFSFITFLVNASYAQNECECSTLFDKMVKKVEENYIGYTLVKEKIGKEYSNHIAAYTKLASQTKEEDCAQVLQDFLRFFKDGHLFVAEYPKFDEQALSVYKTDLRNKRFDVKTIRSYLINSKQALSPIEGVWTDGSSTFALIQNTNTAWAYQYVAVILSAAETDKIGELKFGLNKTTNGYQGTYYTNGYTPRYVSVNSYKNNSILSIWGGIYWGRVDYTDEQSIEQATRYNPMEVTVKALNNETVVLTIPSFLIEKKEFDKVLMANVNVLTNSKNLIIDIRGNTGGNGIYFDLMSLYANRPLESEIGHALASADNIAYFEQFASSGKDNPYLPVVKDMKSSMNSIVKGPRFSSRTINPMKSAVKHVVILTDEGNMSAAETFILHSKSSSDKVTTIGKNTGGVVDYNNINMIALGCTTRGIRLGYPTYTLHPRIPADGYNASGITPDVLSDKVGSDLIDFAVEYLKKLEQ